MIEIGSAGTFARVAAAGANPNHRFTLMNTNALAENSCRFVSIRGYHKFSWRIERRGRDREIGHARAHDDFLDNRARHHRIDHRRRRYPHLLAPLKRTVSSRRSHIFHSRRDPDSLHLLSV